ncbi:uncharacterized protein LOC134192087 [Corticium candelabrum]|uniref:uncharacterized protein LOC134192087 n=1 Tax=Corticium candelabrum TaxID=121492 RepID=UPI002E2739F9|nr:uncharacterized protein LOC134192087 [Corticium candelabrum]
MILFGGVSLNVTVLNRILNQKNDSISAFVDLYKQGREKLKNDVWQLTLTAPEEIVGRINFKVRWRLLAKNSNPKNNKTPEGRFGHIALFVSGKLLIWGGMRLISFAVKNYSEPLQDILQCTKKLWIFDLRNKKWHNVLPQTESKVLAWNCLNIMDLCKPRATILGQRIVTIGKSKSESDSKASCNNPSLLSTFVMSNDFKHLGQHNDSQKYWEEHTASIAFKPEYLLSWKDSIIGVKQDINSDVQKHGLQLALTLEYQDNVYITKMQPGCLNGSYSSDWKTSRCSQCNESSYAQEGAKTCTECPKGLISNGSSASSPEDCSCSKGYCSHGQCFVAKLGDKLSAECQCDIGFTGDRCHYPTYFVFAAVVAVVLIVLVVLLVFLCLMLKYRKQKTIKEIELKEMRNVWTISCSELQLLERIDDGMPGSYGDVQKARYRDMTVAVKKLKLRTKEFEREFRRETELMKSMRHENIVLFIGAGQFQTDDCPFLVVEYMQNGALTKILRNREVTITKQQQLSFCLDTAKGMEFLHSQRPPRIHRDLKSSNLLLSASWVVKVADFGCARLVKVEGNRQPVVKRRNATEYSKDNISVPLLSAGGDMSDNVGAALWRAPEIFACKPYGTAVDVYSFGIVMWEIAARVVPYCDMSFRLTTDVKDAVLSGVRPPCPSGIAKSYRDLLEKCWAAHPSQRPTFSKIVQRLQRISQIDNNNAQVRQEDC